MKKERLYLLLSILNLAGFLGTVIVNALANALPIAGRNTGELSDLYPNLFVPAGLTFSIWGLIYVLLAIFTLYGLIVAVRKIEYRASFIGRVDIFFLISCLANIGWIFAWHYRIVYLSLLLMLILLACLITIYLRLNIGKSEATGSEKYLVHLPFSVYMGWITVATIANVTALLVDIGWNGFGLSDQFWTVAVIIVAVAITLGTLFTRKDIYYSLVVDWALLGIILKRMSDATVPDQSVIIASIAGMAVITAVIILQLFRRKVY